MKFKINHYYQHIEDGETYLVLSEDSSHYTVNLVKDPNWVLQGNKYNYSINKDNTHNYVENKVYNSPLYKAINQCD